MLEIFVLSMCIGQFECGTALKAYYNERPHIKSYAKSKKRKIQEIMGEKLMYAIPAAVTMAYGGSAQIRISNQFSCGGGDDKVLCMYNKTF